jgi:ATP-binding cassette subfamily F protein 3
MIVISHDHFFLDKVTTQIAELSSCAIHLYKGNYTHYLTEKEKRQDALKKEMELQKSQIKKIEEFVERFRYKASKRPRCKAGLKCWKSFRR